jgi:TolB-like protein
MASVWGELKRRNVVRVGIAYAIVSWLILQLTDVMISLLSLPDWVGRLVFLLLVIGFPVSLILAWAFELTPDGIKLDKDVVRSESANHNAGHKLNYVIIAALSLALVFVIIDKYVLEETHLSQKSAGEQSSIAVLPFANRSAETENAAFFADGIHDELLTRLAKIADLKVISRTSVMEYRDTTKKVRQIGAELGVGSILEGGVQRAGDRVRINVQLIDVQNDENLWANSYERELNTANIFSIQTEISIAIAKALRATLTPDERERLAAVPTASMGALEAYFSGKQLADQRTEATIEAAISKFEQAIAHDSSFALAHAGSAYAWLLMPEYSATIDRGLTRRNSEQAAARSLELNPELPEGLTVMAWNHLIHEYDWPTAENMLRRALKIQANNSDALHWLSHVLSWQGFHDEAIEIAERAVESDPFSPLMKMNLSYILMDAKQYERSVEVRDQTLEIQPNYPELWRNMWLTFLRAKRYDEATNAITIWASGTGRNPQAATRLGRQLQHYAETGKSVELSQELLEELKFGSENLGQIYAAAGDGEAALAALRIALDEHAGSRSVLSMKINPLYDFIRDDPRFAEMQAEAGLSP